MKTVKSAQFRFTCSSVLLLVLSANLTTSGCFTRGRIIGKLEEGRSVTSVAAEFEIAYSIVSRLWRQFQTTGTADQGSVLVVHEEPHPQMTGTLSYRPEETGGETAGEIARHTTTGDWTTDIAFYRGTEDCTVVVCLHDALYDESRFSLSCDFHRILIWKSGEAAIIARTSLKGTGMEVTVFSFGGNMLGSRTDLHIFDAGSVNGTRYCNEILLPYVRLFRGAMGL
ncbi:transposable element Tcb1 transposase [Trichonephila clavipes]|nr:transposable element Tcb1 transposase [Trichonephila clavipes]